MCNSDIGRIAKKVNGTVTEKYLWQGPFAMTKGGATYYLGYDQIGTLKVVADASRCPMRTWKGVQKWSGAEARSGTEFLHPRMPGTMRFF